MTRLAPLFLLAVLAVMVGCAKLGAKPEAKPVLTRHSPEVHRINAIYYAEDIVDDEPCCAPLDGWMPPLFSQVKPRAKLPPEEMFGP